MYKPPKQYKTSNRFTGSGGATEKNVRGLADRRGYKLCIEKTLPAHWRRMPKRHTLWRLERRYTGKIIMPYSSLTELRAYLLVQKTIDHKKREAIYGKNLPPHPWASTK